MQSIPSAVKKPSIRPPFHSAWTSGQKWRMSFVERLVKWNGATVPPDPSGCV